MAELAIATVRFGLGSTRLGPLSQAKFGQCGPDLVELGGGRQAALRKVLGELNKSYPWNWPQIGIGWRQPKAEGPERRNPCRGPQALDMEKNGRKVGVGGGRFLHPFGPQSVQPCFDRERATSEAAAALQSRRRSKQLARSRIAASDQSTIFDCQVNPIWANSTQIWLHSAAGAEVLRHELDTSSTPIRH